MRLRGMRSLMRLKLFPREKDFPARSNVVRTREALSHAHARTHARRLISGGTSPSCVSLPIPATPRAPSTMAAIRVSSVPTRAFSLAAFASAFLLPVAAGPIASTAELYSTIATEGGSVGFLSDANYASVSHVLPPRAEGNDTNGTDGRAQHALCPHMYMAMPAQPYH